MNLRTRGGGKKSEIFADVINGSPLTLLNSLSPTSSSCSFLSALLGPASDLRKRVSVERVKFLVKSRVMLPSIRDRPDSRRAIPELRLKR